MRVGSRLPTSDILIGCFEVVVWRLSLSCLSSVAGWFGLVVLLWCSLTPQSSPPEEAQTEVGGPWLRLLSTRRTAFAATTSS
jgi:hypothetical protein